MPKRHYEVGGYQDFVRRYPGATYDQYWLSERAYAESLERAQRIYEREVARASRSVLTGKSVTTGQTIEMDVGGTDLTADIEAESDEAIARSQSNMLRRQPAPASGKKTVKRHKTVGNMSGLDPNTVQNYPPVTVAMPKPGPMLRSSFAQFKKWFDGNRVLTNSFSFLLASKQGKRGTVMIPLRCDPVVYGASSDKMNPAPVTQPQDNYYKFVTGAAYNSSTSDLKDFKVQDDATNRHFQHVVGDLVRTGKDGSTICEPWTRTLDPLEDTNWASASNMIVPGLTQLHLESASWTLNSMKVVKQLPMRSIDGASPVNTPLDNLRPLTIAGNWDPRVNLQDGTPKYVSNYVSRRLNGARQQNWLVPSSYKKDGPLVDDQPTDQVLLSPFEEQYEVQVGKGYIEFTIKNEGPRQAIVELVVFKPNANAFGTAGVNTYRTTSSAFNRDDPRIAETAWKWLRECNGSNYVQKAISAREKALNVAIGNENTPFPTDVPDKSDILTNPYVNFLPESTFKNVINNEAAVYVNAPVRATTGGDIQMHTEQANSNQTNNVIGGQLGGENNTGSGVRNRLMNPYSHIGRAYAAVPAQGKRKVRIPLPKMRYNPSKDSRFSKVADDFAVVPSYNAAEQELLLPTIMNPESVMIAMSLNGARSDFFTQESSKFAGQDFTEACVFVDAVYKETVYPCAMEECKGDTAFNFGRPYGTNLGTSQAYPGVIANATTTVPVYTRTAGNSTSNQVVVNATGEPAGTNTPA